MAANNVNTNSWTQILLILIFSYLFDTYISAQSNTIGYLLCRKCGHEIVSGDNFINHATSQALGQRNDTMLNKAEVLIQLLENPHGRQFEVITVRKADIVKSGQAIAQYSWFSGYAWRMAICPSCRYHLGWSFERVGNTKGKEDSEKTFIGLILSNLLQPDFAESLLVIPKSYRS